MQVSRNGLYKWQKAVNKQGNKDIAKGHDVMLFLNYHEMYPSHAYRWLNTKIRLDTGRLTVINIHINAANMHELGLKQVGIAIKRVRISKNHIPILF